LQCGLAIDNDEWVEGEEIRRGKMNKFRFVYMIAILSLVVIL